MGDIDPVNSVSLDRYRIFHAVAVAGSVTGAAEQLYLSQPAVSQAIKKLERETGVRLFWRTARGMQLTPEGQVLFSHLGEAFRLIQTGERQVADMQRLERGDIRIGASDTLCRYYLLPALEAFHRQHPEIRLHVSNKTSEETVALMRAGRIDFGVVNLPIDAEGLVVEESTRLQDGFIVGQALQHLSERPRTVAELAQYPLILLEEGSVTRSHVDAFFLAHGVRVVPEFELGSLDLLIAFARIGLGVAAVTRNFVQEALDAGAVYEVLTIPPMPARAVGLVTSPAVPLSRAADALLSSLRDVTDR